MKKETVIGLMIVSAILVIIAVEDYRRRRRLVAMATAGGLGIMFP